MHRLICTAILLLTVPALAVRTSHWKQSTETDWKAGTFHNAVATNLGDVKLSRAVHTLLDQDARISAVYCLAETPDGTIYAGTGPQGVLLSVRGGKTDTVLTLDHDTNIVSLLVDSHGRLLIGTGGEKGRVLRLDKPGAQPQEIFATAGVQYVWAMTQTPDGNLYLATGPTGQLFQIQPDGSQSVLLDSDEYNLLSMVSDGKDLLYVGTDPNGLVYRVNRKTKDVFVLYDAAESEISALVLDSKGNLYAATAEASEANAHAPKAPSAAEQVGRPETTGGGVAIPSQPPKEPTPPPLPNPNPGEPPPIPKSPGHRVPPAAGQDPGARAAAWFAIAAEDQPPPPTQPRKAKPSPPTSGPQAEPSEPATNAGEEPEAGQPKPRPEGNAIYRIDPEGFVTEVFRQPVLVLWLIAQDGTILVATGSEGLVYQVNPVAEETLVLAKVEPKQVMCLHAAKDGHIYMGLANSGGLADMSSGFATEGTYTSAVLDAAQVSRFGKLQLHGSLPQGTALSVATRSGNVAEAGQLGWSKWSDAAPAAEFLQVTSPSARYLQYRLTFTSSEGQTTPIVEDVDVTYEMPNMAPRIRAVKVAPRGADDDSDEGPAAADKPRSWRMLSISWDASDPNPDPLVYTLHFRAGSRGPWVLLKDNLRQTQFLWDTKTVADGRYQIRVTASDQLANTPGAGKATSRVSDAVIVDNTPPVIGDLAWKKGPPVKVDFKVVDRTSTVSLIEYTVDSNTDWQTVAPSDSIYDSPEETVGLSLPPGLTPGPHQVTLRATDARGNQAFENVQVQVEAKPPGVESPALGQ